MSEEKPIDSGLKKMLEKNRNEEATASMQEFVKNPPKSPMYTPGINPMFNKGEVTKKGTTKLPPEFGKMMPNPFDQ